MLKTFDFEEEALGNFEAVPMYWNKVAGHGYPLYTDGRFDSEVFRSKSHSFRLSLDGGSVAYQYMPGKLQINPSADYYIICFVKTSALQHAQAQLTAWFADDHDKLLPATQLRSDHWSSATGNDDWHVLHLFMPGPADPASSTARSLVLQLGLLQPQQLSDNPLGKFELYHQDIKGTAWFDDLVVFQLPRLVVSTPVPGNIFAPRQDVQIDLSVSDLGRDHLTGSLTIADAAGQTVLQEQYPIDVEPLKPWKRHLVLPPASFPRPGQYTANLDVSDPTALITRRQVRFLTTSDLGPVLEPPPPPKEFGVIADQWPVEAWPQLPALLQHSGVGLVKLPTWRQDMSEDALLHKDQPLEELLLALQRQQISALGSFAEMPIVLHNRLVAAPETTTAPLSTQRAPLSNAPGLLALVDASPAVWQPYFSFIVARDANSVDLWQIGQDHDPFFSKDPHYAQLYAKTHAELDKLLGSPKLVIPWNALYDFDPESFPNATLDLRIPASVPPRQILTYIKNFKQTGADVLAVIEPLQLSPVVKRLDRLSDFAQRIVLARSANPKAILIDLPIDRQTTLAGPVCEPDELFGVYRTFVKELAGATFKRELTLHPAVRAFLFERRGSGIIVLWNQDPTAPETPLDLALGKQPRQITLFGQATPLALSNGTCAFSATAVPTLIDHVDSALVELRGSFALGTNIVPAGAGVLQTTVRLQNTYADPLAGRLHLELPKGWTCDPPVVAISLKANESLNTPVTIHYPFTEFAGPKTLQARLVLDQDSAHPMDFATYVTVASDVVDLDATAQWTAPTPASPGTDLVIQQVITNTSSTPLNAQAYALVPGLARQQRFIIDLQPGQSTIKRFTFSNADVTDLATKSAAVGIRQSDGKTLVTKSVPLH